MKEIGGIAVAQLEAWEKVAKSWTLVPVYLGTQEGHRLGAGVFQLHYACGGMEQHESELPPTGGCGQGIITLHNGTGFLIATPETILAAVTGHIRNVHRNLEARVYDHA